MNVINIMCLKRLDNILPLLRVSIWSCSKGLSGWIFLSEVLALIEVKAV